MPVGRFEHGLESVRHGFVRAEDPEVLLLVVRGDDVAQEASEDACVLGVPGAGRLRHRSRGPADAGEHGQAGRASLQVRRETYDDLLARDARDVSPG